MMTFTEAATAVLRLVGKPLHYKEVTDVAIAKNLLSHVGKSPEVTMGARLAAQVKKNDKDNTIVRVKPGVFALADWDAKQIEKGLADRTPALELVERAEAEMAASDDSASIEEEAGVETDAAEEPSKKEKSEPKKDPMQAVLEGRAASHTDVDDASQPPDEDEKHRAALSADATSLFEEEDDDEQPIFGPPAGDGDSSDGEGDGDKREGKRRRRRRRSKRRDEETSDDGDDLPTYTVSDAPADDVLSEVRDPSPLPSDGNVADALESVLGSYDRGRGPVSSQNLADALKRSSRGEFALGAAALVAVARSDSAQAERLGRAPRFRVAGNKIALTSWSFDKRGSDRLRAVQNAVTQLSESTARSLADQLNQLPQRAFGELITVLLDRMGVTDIKQVRRPGSHGSELHLSGRLSSGAYAPGPGAGSDIKEALTVAICIRRDGRDIGRERVTELRGALHHYGPAWTGWLISAGQVLSGAREEAGAAGASPVILSGRHELAELCIRYQVGVRSHRIEMPVIDVELLESLSGR